MWPIYILFTTLLVMMTPRVIYGQHTQGWAIYFGNTAIKDSKFSIHHELQLRDYQFGGDHQQTLLRLGLQYQALASTSFTLGYGYIYTEAEGEPNLPYSENRIYQEILVKHRLNILRLRHRLRAEERFISERHFRGRGRYCVFVDIPLLGKEMGKGELYGAFYDEMFLNIFHEYLDTFDRNRLYGGLGYKLLDNLGIQLGCMRQHVGAAKGTNSVLFSLHHQL